MGRVLKGPGQWDFWFFEPASIPSTLELDMATVLALSSADAALGRLAGASRLLPDPHLLVRPYLVREAVASSRIEGTQTSVSAVFRAAASGDDGRITNANIQEVVNYIDAMEVGLLRLSSLPLSLRLIREVHEVLMRRARGGEKQPGEFRTSPVWIGAEEDRPETAVFVPPLPDRLPDLLADWERFLHEDLAYPLLVKCALLHYQFETIHPFLDGNGRLGRLLMVFYLVQQGALPLPVLYLSAYLERNRRQYYDRLQDVRERGRLREWVQYFLRAVKVQAEEASASVDQLIDIRERYRKELTGSRSRAAEVVDLLIGNPFVTARLVEQQLGVTNQGALNLIRQVEAKGWLRRLRPAGSGQRIYWLAPEIFQAIDPGDSDLGSV